MSTLTRKDLRQLIEDRAGPCISLFMPTARIVATDNQNRCRFGDLIREAKQQLKATWQDDAQIEMLLHGAEGFFADDQFWQRTTAGLAVFCAKGFFRTYQLPLPVQSNFHIGASFFLKPLMPLLFNDGRFYVLALSPMDARLFLATKETFSELELAPWETMESQPLEKHSQQSSRWYSAAARTPGAAPETAKIFGQVAGESSWNDLLQSFYGIDQSVCQTLHGEHVPMVLACVGYLAPIYETANRYPNLIKGKVPGMPRMWSADELHDRAWRLVGPHFQHEHKRAITEYWGAAVANRISGNVDKVLSAADEGRVETLLLARQCGRTGRAACDSISIQFDKPSNPADDDLLDLAALKTWIHGGAVYCLEPDLIPGGASTVAAIFRKS